MTSTHLFALFFARKISGLHLADGFKLYVKLEFELFPTSDKLYPKMKVRVGLIRARSNTYIAGDNQHGHWPGILKLLALQLLKKRQGRFSPDDDIHNSSYSPEEPLFKNSKEPFDESCQTKHLLSGKDFRKSSSLPKIYGSGYKFFIHRVV